jgi:HK97 family phage major capsid protein
MKQKTFAEWREQYMSANEKLGDLENKNANREVNEWESAEQMQKITLEREIAEAKRGMDLCNADAANREAQKIHRNADLNARIRELMMESRETKSTRTITLKPVASESETNNIKASGAIELTIHELIPTLHEGLGLPQGVNIVTGVTGNEIWPVSIDDVELEEKGEIETLSEQNLNFANVTPTPNRVGLCVSVSNNAIDNAAFDLMAFVARKFDLAIRKYLAKKIYSQANWQRNKGPFSGLTAGTITLGADAYKNILAKVAEFSDKGFYEGQVCISMDRVTEAELMATPKVPSAAAGFVIENGLCAGYPYTVSHFVNTTLDSANNFVNTADRYIEIGYLEWFALQFHGDVRTIIDGGSAAVAKDNVTKMVMNLNISMTDLSTHINGGDPQSDGHGGYTYPTQAFGLYKIVEPEPTNA